MWPVETTRSLQLTEATDDEFPRVEIRGITWTTLSHPGGTQQADGRRIETEEMQSPSIWTTTLNPIEKGTMAVIQQMLSEEVAITTCDEALTRQRDRQRFNVAPE